MRNFKHVNPSTLEEATALLREHNGKAKAIAGGTDLLGQMKDEILPDYPEVVVNIKNIPGLSYIREEGDTLKIGALTLLEDIAGSELVNDKYSALAEATRRTASPHIREMGTISGNICQSNRCWYYWSPDNRFHCMRKGNSGKCYALVGDNRYHSIFGSTRVATPPCSSECPAGVDIPAYLSMIRGDRLPEAAELILNANPIPAITGRVCPHFCEQECNRGEFDEAVSIRSIERFMGDYILENAHEIITPPQVDSGKTVAVVGSGPAGLSAAYYLRCSGHRVIVFERMEEPGGLLNYGIPPYRLPKDIVRRQVKALQDAGIEFKVEVNIGEDITVGELMGSFDAVFLACGAWKERPLGIKGEHLMLSGLEFLRSVNQGVRQSPGMETAVIGGGNAAIDVARTLLRMGADPIILYRRTEAEMPAVKEEIEKANEEGIKFQFLTQPVEVDEKDGKLLLKCVKMELGPLDKSGRPRPIPVEGSEFIIKFDAVFKAVGETTNTSFIPADFLDDGGRLKIDPSTHLLGSNLFAGGDFVTGPATVVQGVASGREAANSISQLLGTQVEEKEIIKPPEDFNSLYFKRTHRVEIPEISICEGLKSVDVEDILSLGLNDVMTETNRCFNCGCVAVNPSDTAPALIALNASIKTTNRVIEAEKFFAVGVEKTTVLADGELVVEIQVPKPAAGTRSKFIKYALRKSIDFPIVSCASAIETEGGVVKSARICLNAVYNNPYRATKAEESIIGKPLDESIAETAGSAATSDACPLTQSRYKVQIAKTLVKRTILACNS